MEKRKPAPLTTHPILLTAALLLISVCAFAGDPLIIDHNDVDITALTGTRSTMQKKRYTLPTGTHPTEVRLPAG